MIKQYYGYNLNMGQASAVFLLKKQIRRLSCNQDTEREKRQALMHARLIGCIRALSYKHCLEAEFQELLDTIAGKYSIASQEECDAEEEAFKEKSAYEERRLFE